MKKIILFSLILIAFISISAVNAENTDENMTNLIEDIDISYGDTYGKVLTNEERYDVYIYNVPEECEIDEFRLYIDNQSVDYHGKDVDKNTEFRHFEGYYTYSFTPKNYTLALEFTGNSHYSPYTKTVEFEATPAIINIPDVVTKAIYSERNVEAFFAPDNRQGKFTIYSDGKEYHSQTITGQSRFLYPIDDLSYGHHSIEVEYNGIAVKKTVEVTYILELQTYDNVLIATLPSDTTKALEVYVDGTRYTYTPDGIILQPGSHNITARYPGDSKHPEKTVNITAEIPEVPSIIAPKSISMYYKDSKTATFKVIAVSQLKITLKPSSKTVKSVNGAVKYKIPTLTPGKYTISLWDGNYCWAKTTLTVKHLVTLKTVKVKKSAKKLVLQATLKNSKALKGKTVTFKFNGKTYKAKTNSKGIAKVTIKKSVLKKLKAGKKVTYQATYLKDTIKKTAKILK